MAKPHKGETMLLLGEVKTKLQAGDRVIFFLKDGTMSFSRPAAGNSILRDGTDGDDKFYVGAYSQEEAGRFLTILRAATGLRYEKVKDERGGLDTFEFIE